MISFGINLVRLTEGIRSNEILVSWLQNYHIQRDAMSNVIHPYICREEWSLSEAQYIKMATDIWQNHSVAKEQGYTAFWTDSFEWHPSHPINQLSYPLFISGSVTVVFFRPLLLITAVYRIEATYEDKHRNYLARTLRTVYLVLYFREETL